MKSLRVADAEPPLPPPPPPPILIPDELIKEILSLLPVKSLVRFNCVSKSWKLIISDPHFVKLHLHRSSAKITDFEHIQLLSLPIYQSQVSIYSIPLLFSSQNQKPHLYPIDNEYKLIGVCNGLVSFIKLELCATECTCWVRLWNPATRLWSQVSPPLSLREQQNRSFDSSFCTFGFGYDCSNDTYKVVAVFYYETYSKELMQSVINVYDMRGSCWRTIQSFPDFSDKPRKLCLSSKQIGVYVSGTVNWVRIVNTNLFFIVSLDLGTEEHSQMSLPCFPHRDEGIKFPPALGVLKDSLCVLHNISEMRFVIWKMKEIGAHDSWTQLFDIVFEGHLVRWRTPMEHLTGFVLFEDEVLLMSYLEQVLYNRRDNTFKLNNIANRSYAINGLRVHSYIESLVSPC